MILHFNTAPHARAFWAWYIGPTLLYANEIKHLFRRMRTNKVMEALTYIMLETITPKYLNC